jgi:hypothetical protein
LPVEDASDVPIKISKRISNGATVVEPLESPEILKMPEQGVSLEEDAKDAFGDLSCIENRHHESTMAENFDSTNQDGSSANNQNKEDEAPAISDVSDLDTIREEFLRDTPTETSLIIDGPKDLGVTPENFLIGGEEGRRFTAGLDPSKNDSAVDEFKRILRQPDFLKVWL